MKKLIKEWRLRDNVKSALSCIYKDYIYHYAIRDESNDVIHIMHKEGIAIAKLYWFHDDSTTVYLEWLSVTAEHRNKGIGLDLQEIREDMGIKMGAVRAMLWVSNGTWMKEWYKRRGYRFHSVYEKEKGAIWMVKNLI